MKRFRIKQNFNEMQKNSKIYGTILGLPILTFLLLLIPFLTSCKNTGKPPREKPLPPGTFQFTHLRHQDQEILVDYTFECPVRGWGSDGTHCNFPFEESGTFFISKGTVSFAPDYPDFIQQDRYLLFDFNLKPGEHKEVFLHNEEVHTFLWTLNLQHVDEQGIYTFLLSDFCHDGKGVEFVCSPEVGILSYRSFEQVIFFAPDSVTEIQDFSWEL